MNTQADILIRNTTIVTMDPARRVLRDAALAITGDRITAMGPDGEVAPQSDAAEIIDGRHFVLTPGMVNAHIHITGDPLTNGYMADNLDGEFKDKLQTWVLPRYYAHTPDDEKLSAQLGALRMLKTGTTTFIEAGTVQYLDSVAEGVDSAGIRGRIGNWVEGRGFDPSEDPKKLIDEAIAKLETQTAAYPNDGSRIVAWPILVGHSLNPDEVWRAAKQIADSHGTGISAHMSPRQADPDFFLATYNQRPLEHLAELGVLGPNVSITHLAQIDALEQKILRETGTNGIVCPLAAMRAAQGTVASAHFPGLIADGVKFMFGSDGANCDMLRQAQAFGLAYRDRMIDVDILGADKLAAMLTIEAAEAMGMERDIGSLEVGKKADIVAHDARSVEWTPLLNPLNQLVWEADGRSVHSVWVDGQRVIENYLSTLIDEDALLASAQQTGEALIKRAKLPA